MLRSEGKQAESVCSSLVSTTPHCVWMCARLQGGGGAGRWGVVLLLVDPEVLLPRKPLSAERAGKGPLARVHALMRLEVSRLREALAALRAAVGPLARVHAHVLDQLVGRLGQVATLLTLVVVAQAMPAHVGLQRGLVGPQSLTDAAAVLHLAVRLEVALHGRWTIGGIDAERAHLNSTFHLLWAPKRFTNLEPSGGDGVALLVLQELLGRLQELVADVALEHPRDEVDLQVSLVHAACLTHKVAEDALEAFVRLVLCS